MDRLLLCFCLFSSGGNGPDSLAVHLLQVLLYPCPEAVDLADLPRGSIKRVVFVDSTWSQCCESVLRIVQDGGGLPECIPILPPPRLPPRGCAISPICRRLSTGGRGVHPNLTANDV